MRASVPIVLTFIATLGLAQEADLGTIEFPTSGSAEAQELFVQGVLLLHSFEYADARDAFQAASLLQPDFAMAYWGEAMTYNHPLWLESDSEAARAALARLAPTPEERQRLAPTQREKDYLAAVEILFGEGEKVERDRAYNEAMEALAASYPDDLEAAAFHALSILGSVQERDFRTYMRAAAIVEEVFAQNPRHPGAAHYLIHSYDDPVHAPLGLRAARVYAEIAPAATHAQHMISHIYVALGGWEETIDANLKSLRVSEERAARKGLPASARNHHALHWLQYAELQTGRFESARERLEVMAADAQADPSPGNRWYYAHMRAGFLTETGRWNDAPESMDTTGIGLSAVAVDHFINALGAIENGDVEGFQARLAALEEAREAAEPKEGEATDVYARYVPRDSQVAMVLQKELEALFAATRGQTEEAIRLMHEATAIEDSMTLAFGPPEVVKPSHEFFGEVLLALGAAEEAQIEFEKALDLAPRRAQSLLGLSQAAALAGDTATAERVTAELRDMWHAADPDLLQLEPAGAEGDLVGSTTTGNQ